MKYYCECISVPLAEKLKEKGMPMDNVENFAGTGKDIAIAPTYGKVFDWLMEEKGVYIFGFRRFDYWRWEYATEWRFRIEREDISQGEANGLMVNGNTWHEAAEKAIEKALTLI